MYCMFLCYIILQFSICQCDSDIRRGPWYKSSLLDIGRGQLQKFHDLQKRTFPPIYIKLWDPAGDSRCRSEWCAQAYSFWKIYPVSYTCCFTDPHPPDCYIHKGCFPSTAKINLENGKSVRMSELQVGDRVQAVTSSGSTAYTSVLAFLMREHAAITTYKSITTSLNQTISLKGNHLIYARKTFKDKFGTLYAENVLTGDEVMIPNNNELTTAKVINVSSFKIQGAYVPLTREGNIVVNGILASCYASFDHNLANIAMTPMRWYPELLEWIFGINNGSPGYVELVKDLGRSELPAGSVFTNKHF